jgi:hypothetical protein
VWNKGIALLIFDKMNMKVQGKKLCLSRIHYQRPSLATELPFLIGYWFLDGKLTNKDRSQKK